MKKILILLLLPLFAFADNYESDLDMRCPETQEFIIHCPVCEESLHISGVGVKDDGGMKWICSACKHSNWKAKPPYNCGNCRASMSDSID